MEDDVYGWEVTIGGGELLDNKPAAYGLTKEQAMWLYEAILSCVPGSTEHAEKQERLGLMIQ